MHATKIQVSWHWSCQDANRSGHSCWGEINRSPAYKGRDAATPPTVALQAAPPQPQRLLLEFNLDATTIVPLLLLQHRSYCPGDNCNYDHDYRCKHCACTLQAQPQLQPQCCANIAAATTAAAATTMQSLPLRAQSQLKCKRTSANISNT